MKNAQAVFKAPLYILMSLLHEKYTSQYTHWRDVLQCLLI